MSVPEKEIRPQSIASSQKRRRVGVPPSIEEEEKWPKMLPTVPLRVGLLNKLGVAKAFLPDGIKDKRSSMCITYQNVPTDIKGWIDVKVFLPSPYDLVDLKMADESCKRGWYTGCGKWMGHRVKSVDKVMWWRRVKDEGLG